MQGRRFSSFITAGLVAALVGALCPMGAAPVSASAPPRARSGVAPTDLNRGAPVAPIPSELVQPDGSTFEGTAWGDGRNHGYETADGYTVVQDAQKIWRYANGRDKNGKLKPTKSRPDKDAPPPGLGQEAATRGSARARERPVRSARHRGTVRAEWCPERVAHTAQQRVRSTRW